jgi:hypothetical protein
VDPCYLIRRMVSKRPHTAATAICSRRDGRILPSALKHEQALATWARTVAPLKRLR